MSREPVRVLRIVTRLNLGGVANEVQALCRHAARHGVQTTLAAGTAVDVERDLFDRLEVVGGTKVRITGLGRSLHPVNDLRAAMALRALMRRWRPQIVHTHTSKAGALGRPLARSCGVPVICHTYHGSIFRGHFGAVVGQTATRAERFLGRFTDAVVALGDRGRADLARLGIGRRLAVIPPGFDRTRLAGYRQPSRQDCRRRLGLDENGVVLLALGRLARVKGLDVLLRALARRPSGDRGPELLVAGDGPERRRLEDDRTHLGLNHRVRFLGWRDDVDVLLRAADALVLPSHSEGYPHAVVEAFAAGRPVVASRVGEVPDLIEDGTTGLLVRPGSVDDLAAALDRFSSDPARVRAMQQAAARRFDTGCPEEEMVATTCALYQTLLAEKTGREACVR